MNVNALCHVGAVSPVNTGAGLSEYRRESTRKCLVGAFWNTHGDFSHDVTVDVLGKCREGHVVWARLDATSVPI